MNQTRRGPLAGGPSELDVSAHVAADEGAARLARERYRDAGIPLLEPDPLVAPYLTDGEKVLGYRAVASIARVAEAAQAAVTDDGALYVTDRRLLLLGAAETSIDLADIVELAMAEDRLLVTLVGARGVMLDVEDPRQLRVLVAAARSMSRE